MVPKWPWTSRCAGRVQPAKIIICQNARADKVQYTELLVGDRCPLVVVAVESGGVEHRSTGVRGVSRAVPGKRGRTHCISSRSRMLSISCARAFATSLMVGPRALHAVASADAGTPDATDFFSELWQRHLQKIFF